MLGKLNRDAHGSTRGKRDELRRELTAPAEEVAPRLVDDIQLLAVEGFHDGPFNPGLRPRDRVTAGISPLLQVRFRLPIVVPA